MTDEVSRKPRALIFMSHKEIEPYAQMAYLAYQTEIGTFRRWEGLQYDQKQIWHTVARSILLPWRMMHEAGFKPEIKDEPETAG